MCSSLDVARVREFNLYLSLVGMSRTEKELRHNLKDVDGTYKRLEKSLQILRCIHSGDLSQLKYLHGQGLRVGSYKDVVEALTVKSACEYDDRHIRSSIFGTYYQPPTQDELQKRYAIVEYVFRYDSIPPQRLPLYLERQLGVVAEYGSGQLYRYLYQKFCVPITEDPGRRKKLLLANFKIAMRHQNLSVIREMWDLFGLTAEGKAFTQELNALSLLPFMCTV